MKIIKTITDLFVKKDCTIQEALKKISHNKFGALLIVNESRVLEGILTDGDVRRWLVKEESPYLRTSCEAVMQKSYVSLDHKTDLANIRNTLSDSIRFIPLLNESGIVEAVAIKDNQGINIGTIKISNQDPCFIIAEIGNNHNGNKDLAFQLVDLAVDAGADCVKFQMRSMEEMYRKEGPLTNAEDLGAEYTLDLLDRFQLTDQQLFDVFDYCKERDVIPMCTPWDHKSLTKLEKYGMEAYKIASADLTNHKLLKAIATTGKPVFCSTGMSNEADISSAVEILTKYSSEFVLLHCNSTYPAPFKDINLKYLDRLRAFDHSEIVGYSGHERGVEVPIAAVALGAKVIEKHFTIDRNMEGNDHRVSLLPNEFANMVKSIRNVEQAMGTDMPRQVTQGELLNREVLGKSIIASEPIQIGKAITPSMLEIKSPGKGLQPSKVDSLVGKLARRNFKKGDFFFESDLEAKSISPRNYTFRRPFGIPVRYYDLNEMIQLSNFDFVEFHLSYKDMSLDPADFLDSQGYNIEFSVHCPELFPNDHILDLSSEDEQYRSQSIEYLQDVINLTRNLKTYFKGKKSPIIVINAGGSTSDKFITSEHRAKGYQRVADSLQKVDAHGVTITLQTMPPFPWHFGGQRYHNLFMDADEIISFCERNKIQITLDLSHSKLFCTYFNIDFSGFIKKVLPYVAYLHVVDAKGIDGEGLQIGSGEIDFQKVLSLLDTATIKIPFIPEVWQGHKNNGEGFWKALENLESIGF